MEDPANFHTFLRFSTSVYTHSNGNWTLWRCIPRELSLLLGCLGGSWTWKQSCSGALLDPISRARATSRSLGHSYGWCWCTPCIPGFKPRPWPRGHPGKPKSRSRRSRVISISHWRIFRVVGGFGVSSQAEIEAAEVALFSRCRAATILHLEVPGWKPWDEVEAVHSHVSKHGKAGWKGGQGWWWIRVFSWSSTTCSEKEVQLPRCWWGGEPESMARIDGENPKLLEGAFRWSRTWGTISWPGAGDWW